MGNRLKSVSKMATASIHILATFMVLLLRWQAEAQRCNPTDLGFILDSSGSVRGDFHKEKTFLKQIAERFHIVENWAHAGVVSFSHEARVDIPFNTHYEQASFEKAVDAIRPIGFTTRIDLALIKARDSLFARSNGARDGVNKAIVVITDGHQTYNAHGVTDPSDISNKMRDDGFTIVVVGIGSDVHPKELDDIAGGVGKSYRAASFDDLLEQPFIEQASKSACEKPPSCSSVADIAFILDSSDSLRTEYQKEKDFLKRVVSTFGLSEDGFRAGVVTFSYGADISLKFDDHYDSNSFNRAVDNIPLVGATTRIDLALKKAKKELFTAKNGARVAAAKFVVLITDGSQTYLPGVTNPCQITDEMRAEGTTVIVMGIGEDTDPKTLAKMAGGPAHAHKAQTFDQLLQGNYVNEVKNEIKKK